MNNRLKTLATSAALCCGIGFVPAAAHAASLSSSDRDFLVSTAQGATYELAVAKLALTKATRGDVKSYAQTMITDHEGLNPKLHQLAKANGVDLPTTMTSDKQKSYDQFKGLNGTDFETAFVKAEAKDNGSDVATERREIDSTDNASVKAFVEQMKQTDTKHADLGAALLRAGH